MKNCKRCKENGQDTPITDSVTFRTTRYGISVGFCVSMDLCPDCEKEVFEQFVGLNALYGTVTITI
jgi:hypothetical protein